MWPYPWTLLGTPSHLGHMDRVAATIPSQAHAEAPQEAADIGQWEGQDVPLVRPSSCIVKRGIPSSRRYLPSYLLVTDAGNVGGGGTLFQWQALEKEEFDSAISQWGTDRLNRDGTLKHSYTDDKWVLVPLGHRNWKWNQVWGNYSTYEQELLAVVLVLSCQSQLLGSNPVVWLFDQEPIRTFQKGPHLRRLSSDAGGST